uniref:Thyroxine-binding globulin n=1 Tax=Sparus aurata TaxID=8175 RepID=A0A671VTX1_SPAAU
MPSSNIRQSRTLWLTAGPTLSSLVNAANNEFVFRLYRKLAAHADSQGKNIFYSPFSVSTALAALSVGARGETHQQLFSGLGYNNTLLTQENVNQAFQMLLNRANEATRGFISSGTAVFVDNKFKPRSEFLEVLRQSYLADGFNVDFTNTTDSANTINEYVKEKTNGKIDELVSNLDPSTVMYLISYIYFKGQWAIPFRPELTKEDMFNVDENTKIPVQMMYMQKQLHSYYDQGINTTVLQLPFNNSYSMLLLLPDDMAVLENDISRGHVTKWVYKLHVPKFSIKTSYSLNDVLTGMGMTDMFGDRANLSGIVVHQATLDVNEAGATAAAATGVSIMAMSSLHTPVLKFNRPFMVIITERNTDNILFMGKILNPKME